TSFKARVRDYMAAHTEQMERFENAIFKQREEINGRMTEMFGLLKELTTSKAPEKVLIREEAKFPVTKNVNFISLTKGEEERNNKTTVTTGSIEKPIGTEMGIPIKEAEKENEAENEPGLVDNHRFNDSLSGARVGKTKGKTYNVSPRGPVYEEILSKKITRKEDIRGNFEIPCNIGGLKGISTLVDQGYDVNVMPLSTYMKLTNKRPTKTDIRLSLASHSYIYPLGIAEDVLVEVAEHFDKSTITLRSGKSKVSFHRIPESLCKIERGVKNYIELIPLTMTVNRLVLEWEERIKLHLKREVKFNQWRSKNFKSRHPALVKVEDGMNDEGEVM
ncbi:hypothetical protein Tco_0695555, partial [Tanacetum coccineum]